MENTILKISLAFAILGLLFVYSFSPTQKYVEKSIPEIKKDCQGFVNTKGLLIRTFYSKKGNYIGILSDRNSSVMILLNNKSFFDGDHIQTYAQTSEYSDQCWLFPDAVELI